MKEEEPGRFTAETVETVAGLYGFRVRASGVTFRERPFTREQTLTAVLGSFGVGDTSGDSDLCRLLDCLSAGKVVLPDAIESLKRHGIDWDALLACLRKHCHGSGSRG